MGWAGGSLIISSLLNIKEKLKKSLTAQGNFAIVYKPLQKGRRSRIKKVEKKRKKFLTRANDCDIIIKSLAGVYRQKRTELLRS